MRLKALWLLAVALAFAPTLSEAAKNATQRSPVVLTVDVPISVDVPDVPHSESAIAVNPKNTKNILASSFAVEGARMVTMIYYSFDGGRTWKRAAFPGPNHTHFENTWDPVLAFGTDGVGYFITETQFIGFWVTATKDGGLTWSTPKLHKRLYMYDRSYATIGEGRWSGRLFVAGYSHVQLGTKNCCGAVLIQTSDDLGASFTEARARICDDNAYCELDPAGIVARGDGAVFNFEAANGTSSEPGNVRAGAYYIVPSFDGGFSWLPAQKIADFNHVTSPMHPDKKNKQMFFNVTDGAEAIDDSSGPYRNRMYLAYNSWNGRRFVTEIVHSTKDWATWSRPIVADDSSGQGDDVLPNVAVNSNGVVAVVWFDRRHSLTECYQLAAAISYDGGKSFSRNYLHPGITCASNPKDIQYYTVQTGTFGQQGPLGLSISRTSDTKFPSGGDTNGLSAIGDTFGVVWANGASGVQQLWYTAFRPGSERLATHPGLETTVLRHSPGLQLAPVLSNLNEGLELDSVPSYSKSNHLMTFVMRLRNTFPTPIRGPFVLTEIEGKRWDADIDAPVQSDAPKGGHVAPFWIFHLPGEVLAPGAQTLPRTMSWRVNDAGRTPYVDLNVARAR